MEFSLSVPVTTGRIKTASICISERYPNTPIWILSIYNIPYRTRGNIENATIHRLSELKNIIGLKDSCGDFRQTTELLFNKPQNFSILTGEDILFYSTLAFGGDGGIMAAAHIRTEDYIRVYDLVKNNDHKTALPIWKELYKIIPLLFIEPNPAPIKYLLKEKGIIGSLETRLPLAEISGELKDEIDKIIRHLDKKRSPPEEKRVS